MKTLITRLVILTALATTLASCGNTIRGMGRDTAATVDATQDASNNVENAAE